MGKTFGDWEVISDSKQSEGGQGWVHQVRRKSDPQSPIHALKRLKNDNRVGRFRQEVEALKQLNHPGIVPIVDDGQCADDNYFVTPWYDGGSLESPTALQFSLEKKLHIFRRILDALSAAHSKGIVHRDIKPTNILLNDKSDPVIVDFGLCWFDEADRFTLTEEAVGSRYYIAPELEGGRIDEVKPSADVYSAGKVLYWLIAERHLPREKHREAEYDLVQLHSEPRYEYLNRFLDKTVCDVSKRLPTVSDAITMLQPIAESISRVKNVPSKDIPQTCIYCGIGTYKHMAPSSPSDQYAIPGATKSIELQNAFGMTQTSMSRTRAQVCDLCGNVQFFALQRFANQIAPGAKPNPWADDRP